jgi:alpha-galactosidase
MFVYREIGNFCKDGPGKNQRCFDEERSHFGLWCVMSSPLVLGFNLSNQDQMGRVWPIITNKEAIAIDHAWAGMPGTLYGTLQNKTIEIWAKALPEQKVAVLVLNTVVVKTTTSVKLSLTGDVPGKPKSKVMRDVWGHQDVPITDGEITLSLNTHESFFAVFDHVTDEHWWGVA